MRELLDQLLALFPDLRRIDKSGYVVGGAVRDLLRGEQPADVDVACFDPSACAAALGRKVIRLGKEHLNAQRVVIPPHVYDFAEILDGDIDADLARRDCTVNAMAVSLATGELLDPHDGRGDLERRVIRMVDPANFDDDPLRLLKTIRMAVRLGFTVDEKTLAAIRPRATTINSIAAERVTHELSLIFSANAFRRAVELLHETALDVALFGRALDPANYYADDVPEPAAFALIVGDANSFGRRWRWSTDLFREVLTIQRLLQDDSQDMRVALYDAGEKTAHDFLAALRATGSKRLPELPDFTIEPLLTGEEIAQITGLPPGKELGRIKRAMLEEQIRGKIQNRDGAEAFVTTSSAR